MEDSTFNISPMHTKWLSICLAYTVNMTMTFYTLSREGVWDPELWYYSEESEKRSASPIENKKKYL